MYLFGDDEVGDQAGDELESDEVTSTPFDEEDDDDEDDENPDIPLVTNDDEVPPYDGEEKEAE